MNARYVNEVAHVSKFCLLFCFFLLFCCLFYTSCLFNPRLLSDPRCGSIIVDLALKFNSTTKEQDVIVTLNDALKGGKLEEFSVGSIKGKDLILLINK